MDKEFEASENILEMMDSSVENMKKGMVSPALDMSGFEEKDIAETSPER